MNDSLNNSEQQFFEKIEKIMEVYANSGLGKWFGKGGGGSSSGGGWDRYNTSGKKVGKCGDAAKGSSYSACLGKKYVARLRSKNGKKAVANWVKRKKAAQNKQGRGKKGSSSKGNSPIAVKYTIKEQPSMPTNYPAVKVFVSTTGGGIGILMWKQQNFDREVGSDAYIKTYGNFARLIRNLDIEPGKLMISDRDAVQVLKFLSSSEIRQLANKESVITTSIPPEIVHKFGTNKNLQETDSMTKNQIFKKLIRSIIAEEFKGNPNDAAEVESDKLTAHLSEDSVADNIKDLEALLANPDASRAKDYGSIENYKKMLRSKIARLKGDETGMGPEYRVRSDEPAPFGYGLDEKGDVKKVNAKALDQTKDGVVDTGDAVVASRKEKIALSTGNKADAAFYKKIKTIVNKHKGSKL